MASLSARGTSEIARATRLRTLGENTDYPIHCRDTVVLRSDGVILCKSQAIGEDGKLSPDTYRVTARIATKALSKSRQIFDNYCAKRGYAQSMVKL